jgi:hypothetical protein
MNEEAMGERRDAWGAPPPSQDRSVRGPVLALAVGAICIAAAVGYLAGRAAGPEPCGEEARSAADAFAGEARTERRPAAYPPAAAIPASLAGRARDAGAVSEQIPAPTVALPAALRGRVAEQARVAIEQLRHRLVDGCWDGLPSRGSAPSATVTFDLTFDAHGREVARSIQAEERDDPGIAECLRRLDVPMLEVEPPGTNVGVRLDVTLP